MRHRAAALSLCLAACGGAPSGPTSDAAPAADGALFRCETPGRACNAHDPCAIDPVCGPDHLCRATRFQLCDDGLDCTENLCEGSGACRFAPKPGFCALPIRQPGKTTELRCFKAEERSPLDPCQSCDPTGDPTAWHPATGGSCDDKNGCTKDDYCNAGRCTGTYYGEKCADGLSCTDDLCDGKGGCLGNQLRASSCLVDKKCFTAGDTDAKSCSSCEPKTSQEAFTPLAVFCRINGLCYKPGQKDDTGCYVCDPVRNPNDWSAVAGLCLIDGACFRKGDTNDGGCGVCDPSLSSSAWSIPGDACYIDGLCRKPDELDDTGCGKCIPSKSKLEWTPVPDRCLIDGACYTPGATNQGGCGECVPAESPTRWRVKGAACLIGNVCRTSGELDPTACAACAPDKSKTDWSPLSGKCVIAGVCFSDGQKDATGCLACSTAQNPKDWSPAAGSQTSFWDFESGALPIGWAVLNKDPVVGWQVSPRRPFAGKQSVYYGHPKNGNYVSGGANRGTLTTSSVALPTGKKAALRFRLWMDTEAGENYDRFALTALDGAGNTVVWKKTSATVPRMRQWLEILVDLTSLAGRTVRLEWKLDTGDGIANQGEGIYIDDVTVYTNCP
ncbi:MAG: choice-of-anchor J domain-containing protein [Deltaproteobacteria bacterium]|nr:choice-of-anchor J domain-containing protein [Deltaproteobacteria bacterium]